MSMIPIYIHDCVGSLDKYAVIDVRSEGEFEKGHIPGAINIPLLNNEERRLLGICYKQKGNDEAVLLGYELTANKFSHYIREIKSKVQNKNILIYCYRGGLRSKIMSQLMSNAGTTVYRLNGGYKAFRKWTSEVMNTPKNIYILGGYTGSKKTLILNELAEKPGMQVIDLEGLANHRGSAFGNIGLPLQPTQEQFENELAMQWRRVDAQKPLWLEDESRTIGNVHIPESIYIQMREAPLFRMMVNRSEREKYIMELYGSLPKELLADATLKLEKRLGNQRCKEALERLNSDDLTSWVNILLDYYDSSYYFGTGRRSFFKSAELSRADFELYLDIRYPKQLHQLMISLGGNMGNVKESFEKAIEAIGVDVARVYHKSSIYKTQAWGNENQPDFLNQIIQVITTLSPFEVMEKLLRIEKSLGRHREEKYGPRTIDLDILFYDDWNIQTDFLQVPHPRIKDRRFILVPLKEIVPNAIHPTLNKSFSHLLKECTDPLQVEKLTE